MPDQRKSGLLIDLRDTPARQEDAPASLSLISLAKIQRQHGTDWIDRFVSGLGDLNAANSSVSWWAYTTTAKNLLSSPLGNRLFQALAALKYIEVTTFENLYVLGATSGQRAVIATGIKALRRNIVVHNDGVRAEFSSAEMALRLLYQTIRMAIVLVYWRGKFKPPPAKVYAFTYVDINVTEGYDSFFGELRKLLAGGEQQIQLSYLAFIQAPYRKVLPKLRAFQDNSHHPLLLALSIADLWWALKQSFVASRPMTRLLSDINSIPGTKLLLEEALRWDVAKGGYLYNLLAYKAMGHIARRTSPGRLLYPFENKSIEKLLLYALRDKCPTCRAIGYQHTSITPRHTTFRLTRKETGATPLPDLVVTAGDVTRGYLERTGNFPLGIFMTGCALRQRPTTSISAHDNPTDEQFRILLPLSSSKFELIAAVEFMCSVKSLRGNLAIGVRPHPEFPLTLLPERLRKWVSAHAIDFSGSSLTANIEWSTVTAYASSTVALETLMAGKPVINLDLGEIVAPDPVLDPPPLWGRVSTPQGFLAALDKLQTVPTQKQVSDRNSTLDYVRSYFRPTTSDSLKVFLT